MSVKLISYSQSANIIDSDILPGPQELIAFCARVSNPSNQINTETSEKLIKYLIKHKHWSPLEMVSVCCEITTTRDIARQILRHRSFSFQEFSQRYANPQESLGFTLRQARLQDPKNRQNSIDEVDHDTQMIWQEQQQIVIDAATKAYEWAIARGIAKEQARAVLPEGLTMSRMYINGTLRSFIHYIQLRSGPETQKEHREIAVDCAREIAKIFPLISQINHGE
jgi:thymidylate synthase (FAD)